MTNPRLFRDRAQAGQQLAKSLERYRGPQTIVLALPRGGVPVAAQIAAALAAPLDVFVVRKLGAPGRPELAIGAIAPGGVQVLHESTLRYLGLSAEDVAPIIERERAELARRQTLYGSFDAHRLRGKTAIVVDDGLATGASMSAAIVALRALGVAQIIVAVPVAPPGALEALAHEADAVTCLHAPEPFGGVGFWYEDFHQVSDQEVRNCLA